MKKIFFAFFVLFTGLYSCSKHEYTVEFIDFEDFNLSSDGFWNGSDGSGGFSLGNAFFRNNYNEEWQSWTGFSVSNHTDRLTPGYENQYSSITGSGAGGSSNYAVLYSGGKDTITFSIPQTINNIAFCNSSYAYYSMLNGDSFSEKFGGADGSESDFFDIKLTGINEYGMEIGTYTIKLASINNHDIPDFILDSWYNFNLSDLGYVKHLVFSFDSSRKNEYGLLTPAYVCIDNIKGILQD